MCPYTGTHTHKQHSQITRQMYLSRSRRGLAMRRATERCFSAGESSDTPVMPVARPNENRFWGCGGAGPTGRGMAPAFRKWPLEPRKCLGVGGWTLGSQVTLAIPPCLGSFINAGRRQKPQGLLRGGGLRKGREEREGSLASLSMELLCSSKNHGKMPLNPD